MRDIRNGMLRCARVAMLLALVFALLPVVSLAQEDDGNAYSLIYGDERPSDRLDAPGGQDSEAAAKPKKKRRRRPRRGQGRSRAAEGQKTRRPSRRAEQAVEEPPAEQDNAYAIIYGDNPPRESVEMSHPEPPADGYIYDAAPEEDTVELYMGGDSLCFEDISLRYMEGDCLGVIEGVQAYFEHYPEGGKKVQANYYLASCYMKNRDTANALEPLERLASWYPNEYYAYSLFVLAPYFEKRGEYAKALRYFEGLDRESRDDQMLYTARRGKLHCAVELQLHEKIISHAKDFLALQDTPKELQEYAAYQKAKAEVMLGRLEEAYEGFAKLGLHAKKNPIAAEARYRMIQIRFSQKRWTTIKPLLKDFIRQRTKHRYWLGKSFLLMARTFMRINEFPKASDVLRSLRKNYYDQEDGIVQESRDLDLIIKKVVILHENLPRFDPTIRFEKGGYGDGK